MTKLITGLAIAALTVSIAGSAAALNPQPLPPRCVAGVHCGGPMSRMAGHSGRRLHCKIVHHRRVCRR